MNITDKTDTKGLGQIGSRGSTRGLLIQSAFVISSKGFPIGSLNHVYWTREIAS